MTDFERFELVVLDDLRQAGGTPLAHLHLLSGTSIDLENDGRHAAVIQAPTHDSEGFEIEAIRDIARGQAVYMKTPLAEEYDWRIEEAEDGIGGEPVMSIACDPPTIDLINAGAWYELVGGVPSYQFSAVNENGTEILTRVRTFMHAQGFGYREVGTVDSSVRVTFDVEGNCLQIIDAYLAAVRSAGETVYFVDRATSSDYRMDLVYDPAYEAEQVLASEGLNILDLRRHRGRNTITVMTVRGADVDGFRMPLGAGFWRVVGTPVYEELPS